MVKGTIMANNTRVVNKIKVPQANDLLQLSDHEYDQVRACKLAKGQPHSESQSDFYCFAAKTKTIEEVNRAYMKVKIQHADATHVCCAYRFAGAIGPFHQQGTDDGEIGAARRMLQIMKELEAEDLSVFVVRHYGGKHMGKRRFEIYQNQTREAITAYRKRLVKQRQRTDRQISQSSLASLASTLASDGEEVTEENQD